MFPTDTSQLTAFEEDNTCYGGVGSPYPVTALASWSSNTPDVTTVDGGGLAEGINPGSGGISAGWEAANWEYGGSHFGCIYSPVQAFASSLCSVDQLRVTVTNPPVTEPNGSSGIIAGTPFFVFVQAVDRDGVRDSNNNALVSFEANRTLDASELGLPSQFFLSDGTYFKEVLLNRVEGTQIGTTFQFRSGPQAPTINLFLYTYFQVTASREGLVGGTTACQHTIQSNDHFVALPSSGLCEVGVVVRNGVFVDVTRVRDIGPWFPHSSATSGNPCVGDSDPYWNTGGVPRVLSTNCDSDDAGIDLGDGTFSSLGLSGNGVILWRFGSS